MIKINHSLVTQHIIDVSTIKSPSDIMIYCKIHGIKSCVYEFHDGLDLIKYGITLETRSSIPGERMYRQTAYLPGWTSLPASDSGEEMLVYCENFHKRYGRIVNKNNVKLVIRDMTNYPPSVKRKPHLDIRVLEANLIHIHEIYYGYLPPGNLNPELSYRNNDIMTDTEYLESPFCSLFTYDNITDEELLFDSVL